jgi:hypothetical protein
VLGIECESKDLAALTILRARWCGMAQALRGPVGDAAIGRQRDPASVIVRRQQRWQQRRLIAEQAQAQKVVARQLRDDEQGAELGVLGLAGDVGTERQGDRLAEVKRVQRGVELAGTLEHPGQMPAARRRRDGEPLGSGKRRPGCAQRFRAGRQLPRRTVGEKDEDVATATGEVDWRVGEFDSPRHFLLPGVDQPDRFAVRIREVQIVRAVGRQRQRPLRQFAGDAAVDFGAGRGNHEWLRRAGMDAEGSRLAPEHAVDLAVLRPRVEEPAVLVENHSGIAAGKGSGGRNPVVGDRGSRRQHHHVVDARRVA